MKVITKPSEQQKANGEDERKEEIIWSGKEKSEEVAVRLRHGIQLLLD